MALRTAAQFLAGLRDTREVYYRGERVPNVVDHPELGVAARHASIDYEMAENPEFRELAVHREGADEYSAYFRVPRDAQDLLSRSKLIEAGTSEGATLVLLIKEIGSDALFALKRVLGRSGDSQAIERVEAFYRRCRDHDLAMAVAQTDVKGDRSKRPSEQSDPDMYVRVVEKRADGIVVSGAKIHTSCTPYVDEVIVLPSRSMAPGDEPWSLAFAVPTATPGLRLYASDYLHGTDDRVHAPHFRQPQNGGDSDGLRQRFRALESRIFRGPAGPGRRHSADVRRISPIYGGQLQAPLLDALVGAGIAIAKANGIDRASHVRDKLTWLGGYAETVRGLAELAALRCKVENGVAYPDVFTTNLAKWTFAREFHQAIEMVQDLAGGLLVTGPGGMDWNSPAVRPVLEKYLPGAWPTDRRMAMMNLISELTTRLYGGYQAVLAVHAEGSIEAEKLAMFRAYNPSRSIALAMRLAGLESKAAAK